jgi:hypothetical protein
VNKIGFLNEIFEFFKEREIGKDKKTLFLVSLSAIITYGVMMSIPIACIVYIVIKGSHGYNLIIMLLFELSLVVIFLVHPIIDIIGRHIVIIQGKIVQRSYFIIKKQVEICLIRDCKLIYGIDRREKRGMQTLRLYHDNGEMDINVFYYSPKDLVRIVEACGFKAEVLYPEKRKRINNK